jgi:hypothetical protein
MAPSGHNDLAARYTQTCGCAARPVGREEGERRERGKD